MPSERDDDNRAAELLKAGVEQIKEMPGPRENPGIAAPYIQKSMAWPFRAILAALHAMGVRPWQLTLLSLVAAIGAAWSIVTGSLLLAGVLFAIAALLDVFDGSIARLRGTAGPKGAFLDSTLDRIADILVFGALYWWLSGQGKTFEAAMALVGMIVSVGVSFVRAEAEAGGVELNEGLFQRTERSAAIIIALVIPGALLPMLVLLAALGAFTFVQRTGMALRKLDEAA